MAADAMQTRRLRYRLVLLVLTALALLTLDFRDYGPLETIQSGLRDLLRPLINATDVALGPLGDLWTAAWDYNELTNENEQLRAELGQLRSEAIRVEANRDAYRRLLEATEIGYLGDVERVTASVLRDLVGNFADDVVTIDKGRRHGIRPGLAVVTSSGFVGRIDTVDTYRSTIELVSSPELVIGVRLVDNDDVGLGHGVAGDPTAFVVDAGLRGSETAEPVEPPSAGGAVVTAAESRYPAGIPIGWVTEVAEAGGGLTEVVTVELAADTRDLGFVTVLLTPPADGDEPADGPLSAGTRSSGNVPGGES